MGPNGTCDAIRNPGYTAAAIRLPSVVPVGHWKPHESTVYCIRSR